MRAKRSLTEADRVSMVLPTRLVHDASIGEMIACCQPGGTPDGVREAMGGASRTTLWALLQALLEGEKRRAFTDDGTCSAVVQDLVDQIEDELWRRRQCEL